MNIQIISQKPLIFDFLSKNRGLHIYEIGDLDDFFWPYTRWYALTDETGIQALALLYTGMAIPTLLCFQDEESVYGEQLMGKLGLLLPEKLYAHVSPDLLDALQTHQVVEHLGRNTKMLLSKPVNLSHDPNIIRLSKYDLSAIEYFYSEAYPNNWFDSRMLDTGKYFGYFREDRLLGIAGVHVYSAEYQVAALGNIATHADFRGQQIGYKITSALCADLQESVQWIGLNVKSDNEHAMRMYEKMGFEKISRYDECLLVKRREN